MKQHTRLRKRGPAHALTAIAPPSGHPPTTPIDPGLYFKDPILRLLRRITYGPTSEEIAQARQMGFDAYLQYQLNPAAIDDSLVQAELQRKFPAIFMSPSQLNNMNSDYETFLEITRAETWRAAYSKRQLFEKMVEFWSDHFNTYLGKVGALLTVSYNRDVIRQHALDTFPNLLQAVAHGPAMLTMLDNDSNSGSNPNQNYGRELMELHTLGVNGGYTQTDVIEVSRCFTGWTWFGDPSQQEFGDFVFDPYSHDYSAKTVLGHHIPAGGDVSDGEAVLGILAAHPSTALHIATKMCVYLLQYSPPQTLVEQVANVYLQTGGDIKSMISTILTQPNLMAAPVKYKRPYHLYVSVLRALNPVVGSLDDMLFNYVDNSGQLPFEWAPPNGYPDAVAFWSGYLLPRWNFALNLMSDGVNEMLVDIDGLIGTATTASQITQVISNTVFAGEVVPNDLHQILYYLSVLPINDERIRGAFALAISSPTFQWY